MVRRGSHPRLSVILIVEGSPSYAMRALESVQNQDLYDLQIVVVCRDVAPGVHHSLEVAAGRDIHIDLIDVEDSAHGACLKAGFAASRGLQIVAMNADEWFAPQSLSKMVDVACDAAADMVIPRHRSTATMLIVSVIRAYWMPPLLRSMTVLLWRLVCLR
ncbi:MAG: glycosyltransferase family 2 protein [Collinsella sp.]